MKLKIKEQEKGSYVKYFVATFCLIAIFAVAVAHSKYMDQRISDISKVYLSKISVQNASMVSGQIQSNLKSVHVLARVIGNLEEFNIDNIMNIINNEKENADFMSMGVVLLDGSASFTDIDNAGKQGTTLISATDWKYIQNVMAGYSGYYGSLSRVRDGEVVNVFAVPIFRDYKITGAVVVYYNQELFGNLVLPETFAHEEVSYIADKKGTMIFQAGKYKDDVRFSKIVSQLTVGWSLPGKEGEQLKADIKNKKSGTVMYNHEDNNMYISYVPIGVNEWYYVSITSTTIAEAQSKSIYKDVLPSFLYIITIIMTLTVYLIYVRNERFKRMERRIKLESVNDESYRMIMEQTNEIIFEYDIIERTYLHTENFQKTFGYEPTKTGFLGSLESDYIHPDDVRNFVKMYEKMRREKTIVEMETRMINSEGVYIWVRMYLLGAFDKEDNMIKVIGKIVDIDKKKSEMEKLKKMAVMDSATGVYNKRTTEDVINEFLRGEGKNGKHAMLVIDIDDFKGVNDDHGHRLGDVIISRLGIELNKIFRATDIKGRIGGDEFMILIKDVEDMDFITEKAKMICEIFRNREIEENKTIDVSTSIGIAIFGRDGNSYEELYEAADRALYSCKNIKKGTFAFSDKSKNTSS